VVQTLYESNPAKSKEWRLTAKVLLNLILRPDTPIEQVIQTALALYWISQGESVKCRHGAQMLLALAQRANISISHKVQVLEAIYKYDHPYSGEYTQAAQMLWKSVQLPILSSDQVIQEEERSAIQMLLYTAQNQSLIIDQRLGATTEILMKGLASSYSYSDRAQAVRIVLRLLPYEEARNYLEEHWHDEGYRADISDILSLAELVRQELLPPSARDKMHQILRDMVPQFDKIP